MMKRFPIIALVGHSGVGKSTLMDRILERMPHDAFRIRYLTSRPWREASDDVNYRFLTAEEFGRMDANGELATHTEYIGHHYGTAHADLEELKHKFGIQAYTQQSLQNIRRSGYDVIVVKIVADTLTYREDDIRRKEDMERDKIDVGEQLILENSFAPGGLEQATDRLEAFILSLKKNIGA